MMADGVVAMLLLGPLAFFGEGGSKLQEADIGDLVRGVPRPSQWEHLAKLDDGLQHHYFDRGTVSDLGSGTRGVWIGVVKLGTPLSREEARALDEQRDYIGILVQAACDSEKVRVVGGFVARGGDRKYAVADPREYPEWDAVEPGNTRYAWYNAACKTALIRKNGAP